MKTKEPKPAMIDKTKVKKTNPQVIQKKTTTHPENLLEKMNVEQLLKLRTENKTHPKRVQLIDIFLKKAGYIPE
ncbi:MAG: hypothetical protein M0P71_00735 [Melioribacteraceae bacterium]|nr:hypothetical protein [Melioribacteraceae bacterium]